MNAIIVVGWDKDNKPTGLYVGLVGTEAQAAAEQAAESGKYVAIKRMTNPLNWSPLPVSPVKTRSTGTPKPAERKPAPAPESAKPDSTVTEKEQALAKDRKPATLPEIAAPSSDIVKREQSISEQRAKLAQQQKPAGPPSKKAS